MASPFTFFRKNQGIMLVVFTVLLMFVFTVGGIVMQMQGLSGGGGGKDVVFSWKNGNLTERQISSMRTTRRLLVQYSAALQDEAKRKDADANIERSAMIPQDNSAASVIETMVLAEKAREMGMSVSDEAIEQHLADLTDRAAG